MGSYNFTRHFFPDRGIRLFHLKTDKFKTNSMKCVIPLPLDPGTASANALLPFVLYRGSVDFPRSIDLIRRLEDLFGTDLSVDVRKRGEWQLIDFTLETVNKNFLPGNRDILPETIDILSGILFKPLLENGNFQDTYVEGEKRTLEEEIITLKNNKMEYALERCYQEMCQGEPFSVFRYGDREKIKEITSQELHSHYEVVRKQAPLYIFFVGNVSCEKLKKWVLSSFPPREKVTEIKMNGIEVPARPEKIIVEKDAINQGKLNIGYRTGINRKDPDFPALLVANGLLGSFPHSRLFRTVREEHGLAYYIFSRIESTKGLLTISAGIDPDQFEETIEIIDGEWKKILAGEIDESEVGFTKKALCSQLKISEDNPFDLMGIEMINALNCTGQSRKELIDQIEKVKTHDVSRVLNRVKKDTIFFLEPEEES